VDVSSALRDEIARVDDPALQWSISTHLARIGAEPVDNVLESCGPRLEVIPTLVRALVCLAAAPDDPAGPVSLAQAYDDGTLLAAVGALVGAAHGASHLSAGWTGRDRGTRELRDLAARAVRPDAPGRRDGDDELASTGTPRVWFLLDRSGSMSSIADSVVDGYNRFFAEQRATGGATRATVVQFDSENPHEVLLDDADVDTVPPLDPRSFEPRGMTPLYDALGRLLDRAIRAGGHPADQIVVVLTDGMENASCTWSREATFSRVSTMRADGWTFVFLGANQDSYATGHDLAFADGSISNFLATSDGVHAAWGGASRVVRQFKMKRRQQRLRDRDDPWDDVKEAEQI
jgi:hypothetical protein